MKRNSFVIFIVITVVVVAAFSSAPGVSFAATKVPFQYGVWLPYWQSQNGAMNISQNLDSLNEISPFSYEINAKGELYDDLMIGNGSWDAWFGAVRELGIKIIPTIAWFDAGGIQKLLSNTKTRQGTEDTIAQLVQGDHFDGIDIDFEAMSPSTRPYYSLFIQGLAQRLHPAGKKLTCTVVPRNSPSRIYTTVPATITYPENYAVLNQYCDEVRLMAYDQETTDLVLNAAKGNGNLYAPVADTEWSQAIITEALKSISPKKIMLGVPTYGYEYQVSWANGVTTYKRARAFDFMAAMDRADSLGIQPMRDNAGELSFTFASSTHLNVAPILTTTVPSPIEPQALTTINPNASTTFFVSFPDSQSILDKINLAKKNGLRGIVLFKADGDIDPATWGEMK